MIYLLLLLSFSVSATEYLADFAPAGQRTLFFQSIGCDAPCTLKYRLVDFRNGNKIVSEGESRTMRYGGNCKGSTQDVFVAVISVPQGLYALHANACNKVGCSGWVNMSAPEYSCDSVELYRYGE